MTRVVKKRKTSYTHPSMRRILLGALFLSLPILTACWSELVEPITAPMTGENIAHGQYLAKGLAACGFCHGEATNPNAPLSGGRVLNDLYGEVMAPNITPSQSGIGDWTPSELTDALRGATGKGEHLLSTEVHRGYQWMSDTDLISLISYIRSLPPIDNDVNRRSISFLDRNTTGIWEARRKVEGFVPEIDSRNKAAYGQYLVEHVARCTYCHSTPETVLRSEVYLGGNTIVTDKGTKDAPDISGADLHGSGGWTEQEMANYLSSGGERPDGSNVDKNFCPVEYYRNASKDDIQAIAHYLKTLTSSS